MKSLMTLLCLLAVLCPLLVACGQGASREAPPAADLAPAFEPEQTEILEGDCPPGRARAMPMGECEIVLDSPELPRFQDWACAEGWEPFNPRDVYDIQESEQGPRVEDFTACRPPEVPAPAEVASGWRNSSASVEPVPVGPACPEEGARWPAEQELRARAPEHNGGILYVDGAALEEGEGSRQRPFRDPQRALEVAAPGDIVALAVGAYEGEAPLVLQSPVALLGSCVAQTSYKSTARAVEVEAGPSLISGLRVESAQEAIVIGDVTGAVTLRGVEVGDAGFAGVLSEQMRGELTLEDMSISASEAQEGRMTYGVHLKNNSSQVTVRDLWVHDYCNSAIYMRGMTGVSLERVRVEDVFPTELRYSCNLTPNRSANLTPEGAIIIYQALEVDLRNVALKNVAYRGAYLGWVQNYQVRDVSVQHLEAFLPDYEFISYGVVVYYSTQGSLRRVLVEDAYGGGFYLTKNQGHLTVEDVIVANSAERSRGRSGDGVVLTEVPSAEVKRLATFNTYVSGLGLHGFFSADRVPDDVQLYIEDIWTSGVEPVRGGDVDEFTSFYGAGLQFFHHMDLRGTRILTEGNRGIGMQLALRSYLEGVPSFYLTDVTIRGTQHLYESSPLAGRAAGGFVCYVGCDGLLQRARIEDNAFSGIFLHGERTRMSMEDITVHGSDSFHSGRRRQGGVGVVVTEGASLSMDRFRVSSHELLGFKLYQEGHLRLRNGDITDTRTGMDLRQFEGTLDVSTDANVKNLADTPLSFNPAEGLGAFELFALAIEELMRREQSE